MLMELKNVFGIESDIQENTNEVLMSPKDRFTLEFSTEFIITLNQHVLKLSPSINKIDNILEILLKNNLNDSLIYVNDLKRFKVLFEKIIQNILDLMECIAGEKVINRKVLQFYTLIDEYRSTDLKLNFFDSIDLLVENSAKLCTQLNENAIKSDQEIILNTVNLDRFYNSSSILKKLLFDKFMYAKKKSDDERKESKPNSPNSTSSSPLTNNIELKDKTFYLEVS